MNSNAIQKFKTCFFWLVRNNQRQVGVLLSTKRVSA